MTNDEIQQRTTELAPWHYCHILPYGISTGDALTEATHPKLVELLKVGAFQRQHYAQVLDLGANSGLISMWFVDNRGSMVTAIEGNDRYFQQLKFVVDVKGYGGRVIPVKQDLHLTSYDKNRFDLVLLLGTLHHLKPEKHFDVLRACHQALLPAGEIVVQTDDKLPVAELLKEAGFLDVGRYEGTTWHDRAAWHGLKDPMKLW